VIKRTRSGTPRRSMETRDKARGGRRGVLGGISNGYVIMKKKGVGATLCEYSLISKRGGETGAKMPVSNNVRAAPIAMK